MKQLVQRGHRNLLRRATVSWAEILECAGESPAACKVFRSNHGQYWGKTARKMAK
jgi:hypothetical protein